MTQRNSERGFKGGRGRGAVLMVTAAIALATSTGLMSGPGCAKRPADPAWDNPFDPSQPDPFDVRAFRLGSGVNVLWTIPANPAIAHFDVLHSTDGIHFDLANADPLGKTVASFPHTIDSPSPPVFNATNWYKVRALDAAGNVSSVSRQVADSIAVGPYLEIAGGASTTATRHVKLMVRTQVGDSLELADGSAFTGAVMLPVHEGAAEDTIFWDLGTAAGNNVFKHVWLRVKIGAVYSPTAHDSIKTAFQPNLRLNSSATTFASRRVPLLWETAGVVEARLAAGADSAAVRASLPTAPAVIPDSTKGEDAYFTGTLLSTEPRRQWIYGRFVGDFGYAWVDTARAVPDNLGSARFTLAGGAEATLQTTVLLESHAVATHMRFNEDRDALPTTPWQAYADTTQFDLSPVPGMKRVYGQFVNDWNVSATLVDSVRVEQPPSAFKARSR